MRIKAFFVLLLVNSIVNAQLNLFSEVIVGKDKIGLLYELNIGTIIHEKQQLKIGARLYEPDNLFERNIPGIVLGYQYRLLNTERKLNVDVGYLFHFTSRELLNHDITLFDHKLTVVPNFNINKNWQLIMRFAIGYDFIRPTIIPNSNQVFTFVNYEASFGIQYAININTTHQ
ncbi:hypothetical protein [Crocinitomix catalasitica]|uniref:hypothetical protein n=1 Tax=Crocinitomix catalasitica TaxID=184607 RepID=UPI000483F30B|nr:hypothetical protein [Crocinitomix catalasitica]